MPVNQVARVQSTWTKGMQSKVLSARNDTNLLDKGAAILDNVVIMQQGGLRKRPCNKLSCPLEYENLLGVVVLGDDLWAVSTNQVNSVAFNKVDSSEPAQIVDITSTTPTNGDIRFVQDQNVLLFTPQWVNVTVTQSGPTYTFTPSPFIFNSYSVTQRFPNTAYFSTYDTSIPIYIFFRGEGDVGSEAQAQTPGSYLAVGNTVGIWAPAGLVFNSNIPLGTIILVNGLVIKITYAPYNSNPSVNTYMEGIVMIGSTPALASVKHDVYFRNSGTTFTALPGVYCITTTCDQPVFQNNSFGNPSGTRQLPQMVTNFQNRLITAVVTSSLPDTLGGVNDNNTTIWCSAAGNKFSYLQTSSDDDSPFSVTISGNPTPEILNLFADQFIYIFTDCGVYAFVNTTNTTFTPTNISLQKIGNHRCNSVQPISHDGKVFYVQENGKAILSLAPNGQQDLVDIDRTILCPTFISGITYLCATNYIDSINNVASDNSSYLFALGDNINQDTGFSSGKCILSYQFMSAQDLDGWTRWTFDGEKQPTAIYTCQNRLFASFDDNNLYEFVFGKYTDDTADIVDGNHVPPLVKIQSNDFSMRDSINGDLLYRLKKYGLLYVKYLNTYTFTLNGEVQNVGSLFNGEIPEPKSDILRIWQKDKYARIKFITITQQHPSDLQILSTQVGLEVGNE